MLARRHHNAAHLRDAATTTVPSSSGPRVPARATTPTGHGVAHAALPPRHYNPGEPLPHASSPCLPHSVLAQTPAVPLLFPSLGLAGEGIHHQPTRDNLRGGAVSSSTTRVGHGATGGGCGGALREGDPTVRRGLEKRTVARWRADARSGATEHGQRQGYAPVCQGILKIRENKLISIYIFIHIFIHSCF